MEKIAVSHEPTDAELLRIDRLDAVIQIMTTRDMLSGGCELPIKGQPPHTIMPLADDRATPGSPLAARFEPP